MSPPVTFNTYTVHIQIVILIIISINFIRSHFSIYLFKTFKKTRSHFLFNLFPSYSIFYLSPISKYNLCSFRLFKVKNQFFHLNCGLTVYIQNWRRETENHIPMSLRTTSIDISLRLAFFLFYPLRVKKRDEILIVGNKEELRKEREERGWA